MNNQIYINEIRMLMEDSEKLSSGFIDKSKMLPWISPENILGLNKAKIVMMNREKYYSHYFFNEKKILFDDEHIDDDQLVLDYFEECIAQRNTLENQLTPEDMIKPLDHLSALLFMFRQYETKLNYSQIDRERLKVEDFNCALDLIEKLFITINQKHLKDELLEFTNHFYCYVYVSPELDILPNLIEFLKEPKNIIRLENLG